MTQTKAAVTKAVTTLDEAEAKFNLKRTGNDQFFPEWFEELSDLSTQEQTVLDQIKERYRYHRNAGPLAEGVVNLIVVSRLLELVVFYDPPFRIRAEQSVEIAVAVGDEVLEGRLDFLVMQEQFWSVIIESKRMGVDLEIAIPQTMAYMMASPTCDRALYGMVTTGGEFCFLKLQKSTLEYDLSSVFSLIPRRNELYGVFQVLKRIGQEVTLNFTN